MRTMDSIKRATTEQSLLRKLEFNLGILTFLYFLTSLNHNILFSSQYTGLQDELGLGRGQWMTCVLAPFAASVFPGPFFMVAINDSENIHSAFWLAISVALSGFASILTGCVTGYRGLQITRLLLGFFNSAFLPGALLLLSKWYTRRELTFRIAVFSCGHLLSNALTYPITHWVLLAMQRISGHFWWGYLFWIVGAVTAVVATLAAFVLLDLSSGTQDFSDEELKVAQWRMMEDVGEPDVDPATDGTNDINWAIDRPRVAVLIFTAWAYGVALTFPSHSVVSDHHTGSVERTLTHSIGRHRSNIWWQRHDHIADVLCALDLLLLCFNYLHLDFGAQYAKGALSLHSGPLVNQCLTRDHSTSLFPKP